MTSFDLRTEPWILVRDHHGGSGEVSLLELFRRAHELAGLAGDVPTQQVAVLRLLLAILHRALGPHDAARHIAWDELWRQDRLPVERVETYLDEHGDRFDLLHPQTPFFQVADLRTAKDEMFGLERLIADVPNGHAFFTTRAGRERERITFAEAARWVVHCHAYDPSGIKSGAVGDDRVKGGKGYPIGLGLAGELGAVVVEGADLREMVLLNLVLPEEPDEDDRPAWERPPSTSAVRRPARPSGPVDVLTWQSRRIRLRHDDEGVTGVLIANGDPLASRFLHPVEEMSGWRRSEAQEKKHGEPLVYMPRTHPIGVATWRGLAGMLAEQESGAGSRPAANRRAGVLEWIALLRNAEVLDPARPVTVHALGITYGSNNSVIDHITDDALRMRVAVVCDEVLRTAAVDAVDATWHACRALRRLADDLAEASGGDRGDVGTRAAEDAYHVLDRHYRDWLAGLGADESAAVRTPDGNWAAAYVDERLAAWHATCFEVVRRLGADLVDGAGPPAWTGRQRSDGTVLDAGRAEIWFLRQLRTALPHAPGPSPEPRPRPSELEEVS